ncbi:MAG: MFS transporter [Gammaproteobacteria bacterium]
MTTDKPTTIIAAMLLACIGVFGLLAGPIMTEILYASLGLPADKAGQIFAAEALGTALAPLAATLWMSRVSWRSAAMAAILVVILGNLASSYQTSAGALVALRFIVGFFGQGTAFTLAIAIVSSTVNKDRNFAFLIAAQVILGVLCFLLLPMHVPLFADGGIAGVLMPLAALALLTLATIGWIPQPTSATAGHHAGTTSVRGSAVPALIALLIMLIWCTGLGSIWAFVKLIGTSAGLESARVGVALGISTAVGALGAIAASALADRIGRIIPVTVALLVQVVMISQLQGEMTFVQFAVTAAVFQAFWNLTGPYLMGTIALSDTTGKISLLIPTAQIGGFFLGPVITGTFLTPGGGFGPANTVAITCCLIALAIFIPTALGLKRRLAAQATA